jgi:hypothetical protein
MPSGTDVTNLVTTFTTTGASVEVGSTIQVSGTTANNFTSPVIYTVKAADAKTQEYTVTVIVAAKSITAFSLNGVDGTINEAEKTISVTLPPGTSVVALVATFTITGANVKVGPTIQVSGTTANDFTRPVVYTVTAVDATTQDYTVTVTVTVVAKQLAAAVKVSMSPNNPSGVTSGIFCVKTTSITGSEVVTDKDGNMITTANIVREWYVNGVLKASGTNVLSGPFVHKDIITYKVTADGVVSDSIQWTIWCQYSC